MPSFVSNIIGRPEGAPIADYTTPYYFDHFTEGVTEDGAKFSTTADKGVWLVSADTFTSHGNNPTVQDSVDGIIKFATDDDAGDHVSIQMNGTPWQIAADKMFEWQVKLKTTTITANLFVGLSVAATDPYASVPANCVYFRNDADGNLDIVTRSSSTSTTSTAVGTVAADTYTTLGFIYSPSAGAVKFYQDGALVGTHVTNIPTGTAMSPIINADASTTVSEAVYLDLIAISPVGPF